MSEALFSLDAPSKPRPIDPPDRRNRPRPKARVTDPETSHQAAEVATVNAGTNRTMALLALAEAGPRGLNDFELEAVTGVKQTSIGVRRKELVSMGLVERAPIHPRRAPSGSPSIVWRCLPAGYDAAKKLAR